MAGIDYSSLPMGANPETDQIVGYTEFGEPIRRARFGGAEYSIEQVATGKQGSAVKEAIKHPLDTVGAVASGVAGSIWNGLQTPGRAARGETITNGDLTDTLGLAAVGPVGGTAPQGALRSGLSRTETSQQILDMLKGGKAADITDDMLSAADAQYLYQNYDLPMDAASRMQRAEGMGLTNDQFHATMSDFDAFRPSQTGLSGRGVYSGPDAGDIEDYASASHMTTDGLNVIPMVTPAQEKYARNIDWQNVTLADDSFPHNATVQETVDGFKRAADKMEGQGYAGVKSQGNEMVTFNPANIRSRFARFDPRLKHLSNLSAGVAGAGVFGSTEDNKAQIRAWLEGNQ